MNVSCTFIESLRQTNVRLNVNASYVDEVSVLESRSELERIGSSGDFLR